MHFKLKQIFLVFLTKFILFIQNQDGNEVIQDSEGNFIRRVQVNEHGEPLEVHPEGTMVDEHGNHYTHADPSQIEQQQQQQHHSHHQQQEQGAGPAKLERIEPDDPYAFDDGDMNGKFEFKRNTDLELKLEIQYSVN